MAEITLKELEAAHAALSPSRGGTPADYLGVVYLERTFVLPREAAVQAVAIGPAEHGINGFHADPSFGNLYLFRFEWAAKPGCFLVPFQQMVETGLDRIFGADPPGIAPDDFLIRLRSRLLEVQGATQRVFVHLVFNGDPSAAERRAVYGRLREELENKKYLLDRFFGHPVTMVFQFRSAGGEMLGAPAHQKVTHVYPVRFAKSLEHHGPEGEVMRVGFARLTDLHAMFKGMGVRFLETNIRALLSGETATNRSLAAALERIVLTGDRDPLVFAFDHNGVTLCAEKAEAASGGLTLTEPRLLNGAQTLATFDRFLARWAGDGRLAVRRPQLEELTVLCKIITDAGSDFLLHVTLNNNRQNPVKPWNLHANDLIQLELQDKFAEELGVYYERQEKAFAALSEEALEGLEVKDTKALELLRLAQTFLAVDGDLEQMSRLQEVFEDEAAYREVFHPKRLQADARAILLCYKIHLRLPRLIRDIQERGEKKWAYLRRARNLVWALLAQGVLNEPDLEGLRAKYGLKLGMEAGFTDLLAGLATNRVRLAIAAAVEEGTWAAALAEERYGFLRTNAVYEACLKVAKDRWGWARKTLP
ncbi:MAG: AIPR family protein [Candidatus Coatesbacteria bacterium]